MTLRLLAVSTSRTTDPALEALLAKGDTTLALHIGEATADYKGTSLSRMTRRRGRRGHLFANAHYTGAARALMERPDYEAAMEEFIDHLQRRSAARDHRSHPIRVLQDYVDYFHILADAIAARIAGASPTHALFWNVPHLAYDTIAFLCARAMGLQTVILTQSLFPGRFFSMTDPADHGVFAADPAAPPMRFERGEKIDLFYMAGVGQAEAPPGGRLTRRALRQLALYLTLRRPGLLLNPVALSRLIARMRSTAGQFPDWRDPFAWFFHEDEFAYFEHLAGFERQPIDLTGDYIYVPLQYQPEMTTAALGGPFRDQALMIERLADILPKGVRILVKENPRQGAYARGAMFFHRLRRIPAVTLLPSHANTHALAAGARAVATVSGTAGWEAIRAGTPAIAFGAAWWRGLPGAIPWHDSLTWDEIANHSWDHATLEQAAGALTQAAHPGYLDRHFARQEAGFDPAANARTVADTLHRLLHERRGFTVPPRG